MPFIPDDQVTKLFAKMSLSVDALFQKYQYDTTPEERELLRHLYEGICRDLDDTLAEIGQRKLPPPGRGANNPPDPDETAN